MLERLKRTLGIGPYFISWGTVQQTMADLLEYKAAMVGAIDREVARKHMAETDATSVAMTWADALEGARTKARELGRLFWYRITRGRVSGGCIRTATTSRPGSAWRTWEFRRRDDRIACS